MEEKYPYVREKMGTNFLGSPNSMDFTAFPHAMGNGRENPCISHIIKSTIECESNKKKRNTHTMGKVRVPIFQVLHIQWVLLNISGNQFPKLSPFDGFGCLFPG